MTRKITDSPVRNKERTKAKLLAAVGEIIRTEGYQKLGINHRRKMTQRDNRLQHRKSLIFLQQAELRVTPHPLPYLTFDHQVQHVHVKVKKQQPVHAAGCQ